MRICLICFFFLRLWIRQQDLPSSPKSVVGCLQLQMLALDFHPQLKKIVTMFCMYWLLRNLYSPLYNNCVSDWHAPPWSVFYEPNSISCTALSSDNQAWFIVWTLYLELVFVGCKCWNQVMFGIGMMIFLFVLWSAKQKLCGNFVGRLFGNSYQLLLFQQQCW